MDKMKILMAASEAIPYMKTGGLADVVGSLPKYFDKDRYDVRVILPKYKCMDDKLLPQLKFVCHFYVNLNWRRQYVGIFTSQYDGVTYYFVDNEFYFAGDKPYNNIYEDVEKFAFFSKAVLEALPVIDFAPDVIHCNDWQTGLLPVFLKTVYGSDNFYAGIKTVFTIHNMKFQGRWKIKEVADVTGLPEHIFNSGELEFYGEANYLKGGIVYADEITTVSPTYADEICTPEGGEGLDGLMLERRRHLRGIVNGIDYDVFNPMKDTYLDKHFSVRELSGKVVNKRQLQEKYGLAVDKDVMLIGIVSRLTKQKGFDLVAYVMEEMLSTMNVQFIVQGTGEQQYEEMFNYFHGRYPQKLGVYIGYSEENAHEIYAGCDAFLMPSLFEPCGLSQLIALRYGTVPIVRETGGLRDTVLSYNEYTGDGNGFTFFNYNANDMLNVINRAIDYYENHKDVWHTLQQRGMTGDYSWTNSSKKYMELYEGLVSGRFDHDSASNQEKASSDDDAEANPVVVPYPYEKEEPVKPKRVRRTKEQIAADKAAKEAEKAAKEAAKAAEAPAKPTRKRRTKAEIEADKAAKAAAAEVTAEAPAKPARKRRTKAEIEADKAAKEAAKADKPARKPRAKKAETQE